MLDFPRHLEHARSYPNYFRLLVPVAGREALMRMPSWPLLPLASGLIVASFLSHPANGCCPAPPPGQHVVNADQTVILIWDAANQTQHFVRQASFKSQADNFGFLVPSPS